MTLKTTLGIAAAALATCATSFAQANDECLGAIVVTDGSSTPIDTTLATTSPEPWSCSLAPANDLWYSFTPATSDFYNLSTCGSTLDTVMQVYDGTCGALTLIQCLDDSCAFQQTIQIAATAGTTYFIQIGGYNGASGLATLDVNLFVPPVASGPNCAFTTFDNNNGGALGGAVYFDMTAAGGATVAGLLTNYDAAAGSPVGIEMWTTPGTYVGNEGNPGVWTQVAVDDGLAMSAGAGLGTAINFVAPAIIPAGTMGIALVSVGDGHVYTNGTGANQMTASMDGTISLDLGSATNVAFGGGPFTPRVWNGEMCNGGGSGPGVPFCNPNENNSTGVPTVMTANFGSGTGSDLHLDSSDGPPSQFGYFLVGTASSEPGIMIPNSNGRLCLQLGGGASLGRYNVTGGQFNSLGQFDASGDLQNNVGTSGTGAGYDVPTTVPISGSPQIMSGQTWHFQLWHREAGGQSNFSNGLSVTFP